ncbi:MAG TPA: DUF2059 domain-containing protein [Prolixibacteraceae bacterium]|nr:DUF2059 domain-containing protein [Prolixibacteraceae bacterium]
MKTIFFAGIICVILLFYHASYAQTTATEQEVLQLLSVNGSTESNDVVFHQLLLQFQQLKPGVSDSVWANLRTEVFDVEINDLTKQLVPLYQKHFSQEEVKELICFYKSPLGEKLIAKTSLITQETLPISQSWAMDLMSKISDWLSVRGY